MPASRAVFVLGMHRSGTSAIARGVATLGVYLGDNFLDAQPENPTGYWEDRNLVELDDRVLRELGLKWDSVALIDPAQLERFRIRRLRREAIRYCKRTLSFAPVWGFKDPRVLRILPLWRRVIRDCDAEESYVVAVRDPRSVAASLFARQGMDAQEAYRLWLVYMVPFLSQIAEQPAVVVDYDLLMEDPQRQLARIARVAGGTDATSAPEVEGFATRFLDANLRHSRFSPDDRDTGGAAAEVTHEAFSLLYEAANDRLSLQSPAFRSAWAEVRSRMDGVVPQRPARRGLRDHSGGLVGEKGKK